MKVAIIGGGFTGLACATELEQRGHEAVIFEKNPFLGGLAAGFREEGWRSSLERFYHHWFATDAHVKTFARIWGVEDRVIFRRPLSAMETETHGFVQLDSAVSLLRYPELSLPQKIRMGMVLASIKTLRDWRPLARETADAWCRRMMGNAGFEAIWGPLLTGKFGVYAPQINMAWLWARLACRTGSLGTYQGGFARLCDDAEAWLLKRGVTIHKDCGSLSVRPQGSGWQVDSAKHAGAFDALVVAASPRVFEGLCGAYAPSYTATLKRPGLGAQVVILSLKRPLGKYYWYSLRKEKERPFLAIVEHTNFVPAEEFGGEHLVYVADYVDPSLPVWAESDAVLKGKALAACRRVSADLADADVNRFWVFRDTYAQPIATIESYQHLLPIRVAEAANLYHASMAHVIPWDRGTNFALELGARVAEDIARH